MTGEELMAMDPEEIIRRSQANQQFSNNAQVVYLVRWMLLALMDEEAAG